VSVQVTERAMSADKRVNKVSRVSVKGAYNGCLPTSPFFSTMSTTSRCSRTKDSGPYAPGTVALGPRLSSENTEGTSGKLYVTWLNIAWFVPSSIVSNVTSSSMVCVAGGGCGIAGIGINAVSFTSWYDATRPRSVNVAEAL